MKIDEQDFDELRDLINEALQANYEYDCISNNNINLSVKQMEEIEWIKEAEDKLWIKFNDMKNAVKNTPLKDFDTSKEAYDVQEQNETELFSTKDILSMIKQYCELWIRTNIEAKDKGK